MSLSLSEFADRINDILPIIMKEFGRRQFSELPRCKITLPQFFVLAFLDSEGGLKMSELAHSMNVSTAAMTGIVDRLVRDKYIKRSYDPNDRRIIKVSLTPGGSDLVEEIKEGRRKMIIGIFSKISESDRESYLRIITNIKDAIKKEE